MQRVQASGNARRRLASKLAAMAGAVIVLTGVGSMVSGCGFRPMYGPPPASQAGTDVAADLSSVRVGLIPERTGQALRTELEFLLDPNASSSARRYTLNVTLSQTESTLAVERTGLATRTNIEITANFKLIDDTTGTTVLGGSSRAVSGYNLLDNDFSTQTAKGDARKRVVDQLAYEIRNRLAAHFTLQPAGQQPATPPSDAPPSDAPQPEPSPPTAAPADES